MNVRRDTRVVWLGASVLTLGLALAVTAGEPHLVERVTGWWSLGMLAATLTASPLRRALRTRARAAVVVHRARRLLGLTTALLATVHACLSLVAYFGANATLGAMWSGTESSPWLRDGALSWVLLALLALTSARPLARRLRGWSVLHRLIYPAALLAGLHALLGPDAGAAARNAAVALVILLLVRLVPSPKHRTEPSAGDPLVASDEGSPEHP